MTAIVGWQPRSPTGSVRTCSPVARVTDATGLSSRHRERSKMEGLTRFGQSSKTDSRCRHSRLRLHRSPVRASDRAFRGTARASTVLTLFLTASLTLQHGGATAARHENPGAYNLAVQTWQAGESMGIVAARAPSTDSATR